jgi:hypothetical protein
LRLGPSAHDPPLRPQIVQHLALKCSENRVCLDLTPDVPRRLPDTDQLGLHPHLRLSHRSGCKRHHKRSSDGPDFEVPGLRVYVQDGRCQLVQDRRCSSAVQIAEDTAQGRIDVDFINDRPALKAGGDASSPLHDL